MSEREGGEREGGRERAGERGGRERTQDCRLIAVPRNRLRTPHNSAGLMSTFSPHPIPLNFPPKSHLQPHTPLLPSSSSCHSVPSSKHCRLLSSPHLLHLSTLKALKARERLPPPPRPPPPRDCSCRQCNSDVALVCPYRCLSLQVTPETE